MPVYENNSIAWIFLTLGIQEDGVRSWRRMAKEEASSMVMSRIGIVGSLCLARIEARTGGDGKSRLGHSLSGKSVAVAELAGKAIQTLVPEMRKTSDAVQEIMQASMEQSVGAEQIGKAVVQLDTVIQRNASASEELASMAEELSGQAESLAETLRYFKLPSELAESGVKDEKEGAKAAYRSVAAARASRRGPEARDELEVRCAIGAGIKIKGSPKTQRDAAMAAAKTAIGSRQKRRRLRGILAELQGQGELEKRRGDK